MQLFNRCIVYKRNVQLNLARNTCHSFINIAVTWNIYSFLSQLTIVRRIRIVNEGVRKANEHVL